MLSGRAKDVIRIARPRHPGQIEIDAATARRWPEAERLLSLPPDVRIMRNGDIAWLDPLPTFEWYEQFYNRHYRNSGCKPYEETPVFIRRRIAYFAERIDRINAHLGRRPDSLLEIGSGDGLFLVAANGAAIDAIGIDICEMSCERAGSRYGVEVLPGDLLRSNLPLKTHYDVVVMNHVLEHLLTPLDYLKRIHELLTPDGLLAIEIPQQFINPIDIAYRTLGIRRHFSTYSLHHPYFYTPSSIRRLLAAAGFEVAHLRTWLPNQVFHVENRLLTAPVQLGLWLADRIASRGHIIEVFARPV